MAKLCGDCEFLRQGIQDGLYHCGDGDAVLEVTDAIDPIRRDGCVLARCEGKPAQEDDDE